MERYPAREIIGKTVVSKSGRKFGEVADIIFEVRTGELLHLVLKNPTPYALSLDPEKTPQGEILVPFTAVIAIGDFVIVSESELI